MWSAKSLIVTEEEKEEFFLMRFYALFAVKNKCKTCATSLFVKRIIHS